MHRPILAVVGLLLVLSAACGDDTASSATESDTGSASESDNIEIPDDALDLTGRSEVEVTVQDNRFEQQVIVIDPGTTVTWVNEGIQPHNVKPSVEGAFAPIDTGELDSGATGERTFETAGDYPYYCSLHGTPSRGQTGRIIVASS